MVSHINDVQPRMVPLFLGLDLSQCELYFNQLRSVIVYMIISIYRQRARRRQR
ncbi:hypothetical protein BDN72DRAFT_844536 [Pluteus cervinus]|uniref:Uncharacterized protein n=1 Tax=Pluteus cervinus TaxID=181527 RepID=A0ACD3ALZ2_9AGAR|nr:hypothetical protein BDN72DRAFT_844536 [Pluteus cervinus]